MPSLRLILGDQLSMQISSLRNADKATDLVLLAEVREEATYVKHHKLKIAFVFSAMRHFVCRLQDEGFRVQYTKFDDADNAGSLKGQVKHCLASGDFDRVVVTHPGEHRLLVDMQSWHDEMSVPVEIRADNRFLADDDVFRSWARGRKELRMEFFYREMRKQTGYLMDVGKPVGGKWNFDAQNRKPLRRDVSIPKRTRFDPDAVTREVLGLVEQHFDDHPGATRDFAFAVTRDQALQVLAEFIDQRLHDFGQYQDAMMTDEPWLFHSHVSVYLNSGLLGVAEVVEAAIQAYDDGRAPLNSVEGFVRQVIGWREYIRGFYWYFMPKLAHANALSASRALPDFFWSGETRMNCLKQCVSETLVNAYAHHIQRLMVIGNFSLLAGLDPKAVNEWYLIVYADAYEWVEMPNVSSMVLYADGGMLASKPYAASGSYINKMSDYCRECEYSVSKKTGEQACPFNYLYWDFINRHKDRFSGNPRMAMVYRTMDRMDSGRLAQMFDDAETFLARMESKQLV